MATWNYRVIKRHDKKSGITEYAIHEVYYKKDGTINGWSVDPMAPGKDLEIPICDIKSQSGGE